MAICKGCGQAIFFVKMQGTGKKMPCDFTPEYYEDTERGTHTIITPDGRTSKGREAIVFSEEGSKHKGYTSHFATCPAAGYFRKKEGEAQNASRADGDV